LLYATIAEAHRPRCGEVAPTKSATQIVEAILGLPDGAEVELRAPVFEVYGEELDFVFTELRKACGVSSSTANRWTCRTTSS
jgi:excinuclease ABC subunit A